MTGRPVKKRIDIALNDLKQDENATYTYSLAHELCGEDFEIVIDTLKETIENAKRKRPPIESLFLDTGLDIYNAFHWHYLVDAFAKAYLPMKRGGSRKRPKSSAELTAFVQSVRNTIEELKGQSTNKYTRVTAEKAFAKLAGDGSHGSNPATVKRRYHFAVKTLEARSKRKKRALKK